MISKKVAIFTLTKDRIDYTKRMFASLVRFTHTPFDHFVIDNGSTDGTVDLLKKKPGSVVEAIYNNENKGLSVSWNQALDLIGSDYDYIIKMDNDCEILTDSWLASILEISAAFNNKIVLSPYVDGLRENKGGAARYDKKNVCGYEVGLTKHLGGISLVVPAAAYESFRFNEKLPLRGGQDVTFSSYVSSIGYLMGYVEDIRVCHMDTTDGQEKKYPEYFQFRDKEAKKVYAENSLVSLLLRPYRSWKRRRIIKSIN